MRLAGDEGAVVSVDVVVVVVAVGEGEGDGLGLLVDDDMVIVDDADLFPAASYTSRE